MHLPFISIRKSTAATRRPRLPRGSSVVVVGNGMAGARFCEQLVEKGGTDCLHLTVLGGEPRPAYDRIRLSSFVDHRDAGALALHSADWYRANRIRLHTGDPVVSIDRSAGLVCTAAGREVPYEVLVLATGARPFVPPIEGIDRPGVYFYRTIEDLEAIIAAAQGRHRATIIGGGLLGLEAAQAVQKLGLEAHVVERAGFLMPQQLNESASRLLQEKIRAQNITLHLGKTTTAITRDGSQLALGFTDGAPLASDLIIVSAGIQPNSEAAAESGLPCGVRGGVVVDPFLQTEDPAIFAIGECALVHGRIFGLAAPGYAMADYAVDRILGRRTPPFPVPDLSTRLKMLGVDVVTIGDSLQEGRLVEFSSGDFYRALVLDGKNRLRGGLGVGPWPEAGHIQSLRTARAAIKGRDEAYFLQEGVLSPIEAGRSVTQWPDERIVCNCMHVNKGQLVSAMAKCGRDLAGLAKSTGASTVCGSCRPCLEELCGADPTTSRPIGVRALLGASSLALLVAIGTVLSPPMAMAESVQSWWYEVDQLWRNGTYKQVSGFTLLGLCLVGLLLSLRKRLSWFRFGHFAKWRVFHAVFGVVALVTLFAHTGFRFGHNLNFWLMFTFVGLNLLGAVAGMVSALEGGSSSGTALIARRLRPALTYAHLALFWPLPVLLTFHILSVYFY